MRVLFVPAPRVNVFFLLIFSFNKPKIVNMVHFYRLNEIVVYAAENLDYLKCNVEHNLNFNIFQRRRRQN